MAGEAEVMADISGCRSGRRGEGRLRSGQSSVFGHNSVHSAVMVWLLPSDGGICQAGKSHCLCGIVKPRGAGQGKDSSGVAGCQLVGGETSLCWQSEDSCVAAGQQSASGCIVTTYVYIYIYIYM